jgi:hypothetical protein
VAQLFREQAWLVDRSREALRLATSGRGCPLHRVTLRAIRRLIERRLRGVLGVGLDGFDYEIQPVGAVDFAGDAVIVSVLDVAAGFREVMQPVDSASGIVAHHEHRVPSVAVFVAVKQNEVIRAEVEHGRTSSQKPNGNRLITATNSDDRTRFPPVAAPLWSSLAGLLLVQLSSQRGAWLVRNRS